MVCNANNFLLEDMKEYNRIIRPWKSRLGLLYVEKSSVGLDLRIVLLTAVAIVDREWALRGVIRILESLGAPQELVDVCRRESPLPVAAPPGSHKPVTLDNVAR